MNQPSEDQSLDDFGFLALYDPDGNQVHASREDLLSIEAKSFDQEVHRRVAGDRSGRYWLISNRPGYHAMLLEVSIFHCYPREGDNWEISYCTNGIASYDHWTFESGTRFALEKKWSAHPDDGAPIADNVLEIARHHVSYRLGRTPGPDPLDIFGVRTRDAVDMRERLAPFLDGTADASGFIRDMAGRKVAIFELALSVTMFCAENGIEGSEEDILEIMVADENHEQLNTLLGNLADQLGSE